MDLKRNGYYGFYNYHNSSIEISDGLYGTNLAIIVLHEVLHFLDDCEGLTDKTNWVGFIRMQAQMLMTFWKSNPTFWCWWLSLVNPLNSECNHPELLVA